MCGGSVCCTHTGLTSILVYQYICLIQVLIIKYWVISVIHRWQNWGPTVISAMEVATNTKLKNLDYTVVALQNHPLNCYIFLLLLDQFFLTFSMPLTCNQILPTVLYSKILFCFISNPVIMSWPFKSISRPQVGNQSSINTYFPPKK